MSILSDRHSQLISAIVKEHIESSEPVGSKILVEKYSLGVSAATVRNELIRLTEQGFLGKPHFSAGRTPTSLAFRHFIKDLMEVEEISVVKEVALKQKLWETRQNPQQLVQQAVTSLAEETQNLALALINNSQLHHAGMANLLNHQEFYNIDLTRTVLRLLDETGLISSLFQQVSEGQEQGVLIGRDLGLESLSPCGLVFARIQPSRDRSGFLAVIGPARLDYPRIIPLVRYFRELVNQLGQNL
ncbi:hypothetical protein KJ596_02010 [Patescibacteria group bacterium]|nr:hypothetical protein [Patescibacteria group bacterium]MBU1868718.1 hypothetical protein [Patescibacteria group bacterium]